MWIVKKYALIENLYICSILKFIQTIGDVKGTSQDNLKYVVLRYFQKLSLIQHCIT